MNPISRMTHLAAAVALLGLATMTCAAVTPQEAEQLKTTLTPMGAERAGNKEGTIPAWIGGNTSVPPDAAYKAGDRRLDPFAADKVLFSITAENMEKYADKLSDGSKALLKKYKTFRIDVYPTRRTAVAPQWFYDKTFKNATTTELLAGGMAIDEAGAGGVPFPIPKNADEVRWNSEVRWRGESIIARQKIWTVTPTGQQVLASDINANEQFPWNYNPTSEAKFDAHSPSKYYQQFVNGPSFRAGEALMAHFPLDYSKGPEQAWTYLAGQRRVRRAPGVGFDMPDFVASGVNFFDEVQSPFGSPERFDWKLIGKKEIYVPYNNNKLFSVKDQEAMGINHMQPEYVRWELHRVWVIETTRKEGQRHAVPKRRMYIDEDSWSNLLLDGWDEKGDIWRTTQLFGFTAPDIPAYVGGTCLDAFYNLQTGQYVYHCGMGDNLPQYQAVKPRPASFFSPDALAGKGVR